MPRRVQVELSDDEFKALRFVSARYEDTPGSRIRAWIRDPLRQAEATRREAIWAKRRARIERNPDLAEVVDG